MLSGFVLTGLLSFLLITAMPAHAASEGPAQSAGWQAGVDAYLWTAGIGAETVRGDTIEVPFKDIVNKLQLGFMALSMCARTNGISRRMSCI
jgi:hypothetical protein